MYFRSEAIVYLDGGETDGWVDNGDTFENDVHNWVDMSRVVAVGCASLAPRDAITGTPCGEVAFDGG